MDMQTFNWSLYLYSFYAIGLFALMGWMLSLITDKVSHVDSMWSLFFLLAGYSVALLNYELSPRIWLVLTLLTIWSVRLCIHIAWRNVVIRQNNEPNFWFKSIYIVFGLQAVLAWIISLSIYGALDGDTSFKALDYIALVLVLFGLYWEIVGDYQLSRFKANPVNKNAVLNTGLWRYTRHPNYFGECCVWWGFFLFALAAGAWWAIISPILMTLLLLKVSGVSLLESTITERRPAYLHYIKTTNAFIPGMPKHVE
jgi:steroid 5-alpha reductase family enzyme